MKKKHLKRLVADLRERAIDPAELSAAVAQTAEVVAELADARAVSAEAWGTVERLRSERADLNRQLNELRAELARKRLADKLAERQAATCQHVLVHADGSLVTAAAGVENSGHVDVTINGHCRHLAPGEQHIEAVRPYPPNPEYAAPEVWNSIEAVRAFDDGLSPKGDQG